ncbi:tetratricopeptide repeat protein [Rapidithrix thailandica]|uniref:Tetratricopeptide repeat protein n=1 Tax=Rapidithrix thailandica TaxID=413964 RepID=A0AAW9S7P2_9BACT
MSEKLHRYPGVKPFSVTEKNLFFGREKDIQQLTKFINIEQLVVLYSKSGLGKSSLLNAGVIPVIEAETDYEPISIRFGSYQAGSQYSPLEVLVKKIAANQPKVSFLDKICEGERSLWYYLKNIQIHRKTNRSFFLVFDQFEELFTYPRKQVNQFKSELADVLHSVIPQKYRAAMEEKSQTNPEFLSDHELELLYQPLNIKVLMAIRSDKMSLMNQLKDYLPGVLNKTYELGALSPIQAEDAILNPAYKRGEEFICPPFDFSDIALDRILGFLTKGGEQKIESFQLQIICQSVESMVLEEGKRLVEPEDLGDISNFFKNYYDNLIAKIPDPDDRVNARVFIEEGLIFEDDQRRLSLYEGQIYKNYNISKELLRQLVNTHLLRAEPNTAGGFSFELSHDSLVVPILNAKQKRLALEAEANAQRKLEEERLAEQKRLEEERKEQSVKYTKRIAVIIGVALILSMGLSILAYLDRKEALRSSQQLEIAMDSLEIKRHQLEDLLKILRLEKDTAEMRRVEAELLRVEADEQRRYAEEQRLIALEQAFSLQKQLQRYDILKNEARWLGNLTEKQKEFAVDTLLRLVDRPAQYNMVKNSMVLAAESKLHAQNNLLMSLKLAKEALAINRNSITQTVTEHIPDNLLLPQTTFVQDRPLETVVITPDNQQAMMANAYQDELLILDLSTGKRQRVQAHRGGVSKMALSSDGSILVTAGTYDKTVKIWPLSSMVPVTLSGNETNVRNVLISQDGKLLAVSLEDGSLKLWNRAGQLVKSFTTYDRINSMVFGLGGRYLFVGLYDKVEVIDVAVEKVIGVLETGYSDNNAMAVSVDGHYLLTASYNTIQLWENNWNKSPLKTYKQQQVQQQVVKAPKEEKNQKRGYNKAQLQMVQQPLEPQVEIEPENFQPDYVESRQFLGHQKGIKCLQFSKDARYILSASDDNTARVWELGSEEARNILIGHEKKVTQARFVYQDRYVMSVSEDSTLRLWDYLNNRVLSVNDLFQSEALEPLSMKDKFEYGVLEVEDLILKGNLEDILHAARIYYQDVYGFRSVGDSLYYQERYSQDSAYLAKAKELTQTIFNRFDGQLSSEQALLDRVNTLLADIYDKEVLINALHIPETELLGKVSSAVRIRVFQLKHAQLDKQKANSVIKMLEGKGNQMAELEKYRLFEAYWQGSMQVFEQLESRYPNDKELMKDYSMALNDFGIVFHNELDDYEKALSFYLKAVKVDARNKWAWRNQGIVYANKEQSAKAIQALEKAIAVDSAYADAYYYLGREYGEQKQYKKAVEYLNKATALSPDNADYWNTLGINYEGNGNNEFAEKSYRKAIEIDANHKWAWRNLGMMYKEEGRYDEAKKHLQQAIRIDPEYVNAIFNLGVVYDENKELAQAKVKYRKVLELDPEYQWAWRNLGDIYRLENDQRTAVDAYRKALAIDPEYPQAFNGMGLSFQKLKNYPRAIYYFEKALKADSLHKWAWRNLGEVYREQNQFQKAIDHYQQAVGIDANYIAPLNEMGLAYEEWGKEQEAIQAYTKAVTSDPTYKWAWRNMGLLYFQSQKLQEAYDCFQKADAIDPDYLNQNDWSNLGNAFFNGKQYENTVKIYELLTQKHPDNLTNWGNLSYYYLFTRQYSQAIEVANKGIAMGEEGEWVYTNLALGYLLSGNFDKAASIYNQLKNKAYTQDDRYGDQYKYYKEVFLSDLMQLENAGIIRADQADVKRVREEVLN